MVSHHATRGPIRQVSNIDKPQTKTGLFGCTSNLVNAIIGSGIIGIPYAMRQSGLVAATLLLIMVGIFTDKSLRLIVDLATYHPKLRHLGILTFEDAMTVPFGGTGRLYILTTMSILAYGSMISYLLIVKDNVPHVLGLEDAATEQGILPGTREVVMVITSLLVMLPLCLLRDISELALTSVLSVAADALLVSIVCVYAPLQESMPQAGGIGKIVQDNWIHGGIFIGLGVLSSAMACQHSSFLISGTLENHTPRRWAQVTGSSLFIATSLSLAFGIVGYLGFLDDTKGDVLLNFGENTVFLTTARGLLSLTMFLTYPMECFVLRHVVSQIFFNGQLENNAVGENGELIPESKFLGILGRREQITIGLYVASVVPAMLLDDLGPVLSLTGALGASSIAYIAPGLLYLGLNGDEFLAWHALSSIPGEQNKLPLEGNASCKIPELPSRQPWWWWPLGMPIWLSIAQRGAEGCNEFLSSLEQEVGRPLRGDESIDGTVGQDETESGHPNKGDHAYSMVLVVFGVIATIAGVGSNIYDQAFAAA